MRINRLLMGWPVMFFNPYDCNYGSGIYLHDGTTKISLPAYFVLYDQWGSCNDSAKVVWQGIVTPQMAELAQPTPNRILQLYDDNTRFELFLIVEDGDGLGKDAHTVSFTDWRYSDAFVLIYQL